MKDNLFVVYHVKHNGEIVYIGYGSQTRPAHATSGVSNNYHLNRLHHTGEVVETEIVFTTTDKAGAKQREKEDIINFSPIYNSVYVVTDRQDAANKGVAARMKVDSILRSLDRNRRGTLKIKEIFDTLLKMYTIPQLIIGVNIKGIDAPHFVQLRRLSKGTEPSQWYSDLIGTELLKINGDGRGNTFLRLIL